MFLHSAALKQIEDASPEHESVKSMKMRKGLAAERGRATDVCGGWAGRWGAGLGEKGVDGG